MVHVAPAVTLEGQLLVSEKSAPVRMLVTLRLAVPVLVRVTVCGGLVVLRSCVPKVRLAGDRVTAGVPACAAALQKTRLKVAHRIARVRTHIWNKLRKPVGGTQPRLQRTGFSLSVNSRGRQLSGGRRILSHEKGLAERPTLDDSLTLADGDQLVNGKVGGGFGRARRPADFHPGFGRSA